MADQSGTGQRENSDQIPDVSATQKNLCHQATMEFVAYIHNKYFSLKKRKLL